MPDVFHPTVFEKVAKAHPKLSRRMKPEHFGSYQGINEALGWLPPQDRCDAVYADWLEPLFYHSLPLNLTRSPSAADSLRQTMPYRHCS